MGPQGVQHHSRRRAFPSAHTARVARPPTHTRDRHFRSVPSNVPFGHHTGLYRCVLRRRHAHHLRRSCLDRRSAGDCRDRCNPVGVNLGGGVARCILHGRVSIAQLVFAGHSCDCRNEPRRCAALASAENPAGLGRYEPCALRPGNRVRAHDIAGAKLVNPRQPCATSA
jgi:hypothetical protein